MREQTHYWHNPTLDNLELLHATYVTHRFAPHVHEGYAIGVIVRGVEAFAYRGTNHVASAGSIVLINPGEVHTGHAVTPIGWTYRMLYPDAEQLRRVAAQIRGKRVDYPFFSHAVIEDPDLARHLIAVHQQLEMGVDILTEESLWLGVLAKLITRHADAKHTLTSPLPKAGRETIRQALAYLHDHYATAISLDDLASLVYLSPYHFVRLFKAELGIPPHAYLIQLRVHRAKALLAQGLPIAAVAQHVGFTDQSHLSRHFKRIVGVPPGQYVRL